MWKHLGHVGKAVGKGEEQDGHFLGEAEYKRLPAASVFNVADVWERRTTS